MKTRNATQLKARINAMAKEAGIPAQAMMQSYLLERLLERLSNSPWRNNVVIKGGVLAVAIRLIAAGCEGECEHKSKCHKSKETFAGFHVGFLLILVLLYGVLRRSQLFDGDRPAAARTVHDVG